MEGETNWERRPCAHHARANSKEMTWTSIIFFTLLCILGCLLDLGPEVFESSYRVEDIIVKVGIRIVKVGIAMRKGGIGIEL